MEEMRSLPFALLALQPIDANLFRRSIPINIINLDKETDRWAKVTQGLILKGVHIRSISRYPAICGKALTKDEMKQNSTLLTRLFCTPGTIGCYLSHRNVWHKICRESAQYQIVMEDDVLVSDDFCSEVEIILRELQENDKMSNNWDAVLLGSFGAIHPDGKYGVFRLLSFAGGRTRKRRKVTAHSNIPHRPFGMHAYILSKQGAEKLLRSAYVANGHVDVTSWGVRELVLLCCDPLLAYQDMTSPSTIGAIVRGPETWIPRSITIDKYTNITLEWALNEPLIRIPGLDVLITIGRSLFWAFGGAILGIVLWLGDASTWFLSIHLAAVVFVFWLLRVLHEPVGKPDGVAL